MVSVRIKQNQSIDRQNLGAAQLRAAGFSCWIEKRGDRSYYVWRKP